MDQWQAFVNWVVNLRVPSKAENILNSWLTVSFSVICSIELIIHHIKRCCT